MRYKSLTIILFFLIILFCVALIFWQQTDFLSFWERKFSKTESEGFDQLYVLEVPPQSDYVSESASGRFYGALQLGEDIIAQNPDNILPGLLQTFDVEYVFLRDRKYWELFAPFLDYPSGEGKEELPRTFPVKKEMLNPPSQPFLILGEGWYAQKKDTHGDTYRWFGKEATIYYVIPPGTLGQVSDFLSFSVLGTSLSEKWEDERIEVIVNGKMVYSSGSYSSVVLSLSDLKEGVNEIKLRSSRGCVVSEGDNRCFSFSVQKVELFKLEDIPPEGLPRLNRFIEIEEGRYWIEADATIHIFTIFSTPSLVTFQIQAVDDEPRLISIMEKDKEVKRIIIFGKESQIIELSTYQQGENIFHFEADDCEDKMIEEEKQCITAQVENLEIKLLK